jgi:hypothetical protein
MTASTTFYFDIALISRHTKISRFIDAGGFTADRLRLILLPCILLDAEILPFRRLLDIASSLGHYQLHIRTKGEHLDT